MEHMEAKYDSSKHEIQGNDNVRKKKEGEGRTQNPRSYTTSSILHGIACRLVVPTTHLRFGKGRHVRGGIMEEERETP